VLLVALASVSHQIRKDLQGIAVGDHVLLPAARLADGAEWREDGGRCALVRFAGPDCPYCRAEQPQAGVFRQRIVAAGCDAVSLAPTLGRIGSLDGNTLTSFAMGWADAPLRFRFQPTAVLLDRSGRVIWTQVGQMPPGAAERGLAALGRAKRESR